jgi:hypothetical protein
VPGALYHDLGLAGMVAGGLILGALAALSRRLALAHRTSVPAVGLFAAVHTVLYLSPIHFAVDFMAFPFICISFLVVPALAFLARRMV